jgi:hypothetical protein
MITLWDSPNSMRASAQEADQLRQRTADMSNQKIANVALYDVSMAQTVGGRPSLSIFLGPGPAPGQAPSRCPPRTRTALGLPCAR